MLKRADQQIARQLDIARFIKLRQMQVISMMALFKPFQLPLIDKVSTMLMHESSDLSEKDLFPLHDKNLNAYKVKKFVRSRDPIDQQILNTAKFWARKQDTEMPIS